MASIEKNPNFDTTPFHVIVRAFGDEPVRLRAINVHKGFVEVAGKDDTKSVGFRRDWVFRFDEGLYGRLREAFDKGDEKSLIRLWQQASPLVQ